MVQEEINLSVKKWDIRHLRMAREIASWSKDPSVKVGSVIVTPDRRPISYGYNGFPPSMKDTDERLLDNEFRRENMIHAEVNAIFNADREKLKGAHLYIWPFNSCYNCALKISSVGITRVVVPSFTVERWQKTFEKVDKYFKDCNIELVKYEMSEVRESVPPYNTASPLD